MLYWLLSLLDVSEVLSDNMTHRRRGLVMFKSRAELRKQVMATVLVSARVPYSGCDAEPYRLIGLDRDRRIYHERLGGNCIWISYRR